MDSSMIDRLRQLVSADQAMLDNPTQLGNRLADAFPNNRLEVKLLREALREGVVSTLRSAGPGQNPALVQGRLAKRLEDNVGLSAENARWAVEAWAVALGLAKAVQQGPRTPPPPPQPPPIKPPPSQGTRPAQQQPPPVRPSPGPGARPTQPPLPPPAQPKPAAKAGGSAGPLWIGAVVVAVALAGAFFWMQGQGSSGRGTATTTTGAPQPICVPRGGTPPLGDWKYC